MNEFKEHYIMGEDVLKEVEVWSKVLSSVINGIPRPYDPTITVKKLKSLEADLKCDLSEIINCCPPPGDVRETNQLKPFIFKIISRIEEITKL